MANTKKWGVGLWIAIGIAIVLIAINTPLMGLHGVLVFIVGDQLAMALFGKLHGDNYWPIGIYMGFLWPPGIPISYIVAARISIPNLWSLFPVLCRVLIFIFLLSVWIVVLSTAFHLLVM